MAIIGVVVAAAAAVGFGAEIQMGVDIIMAQVDVVLAMMGTSASADEGGVAVAGDVVTPGGNSTMSATGITKDFQQECNCTSYWAQKFDPILQF